jgi:hypothetical protein
MKILLGITATTWLIGQTANTLGLPSGLGSFANLTAIGLMGYMFYRIVLKDMPQERTKAREAAERERINAREHTERVVASVVEQHRADRDLDRGHWAAELDKCRVRNEG